MITRIDKLIKILWDLDYKQIPTGKDNLQKYIIEQKTYFPEYDIVLDSVRCIEILGTSITENSHPLIIKFSLEVNLGDNVVTASIPVNKFSIPDLLIVDEIKLLIKDLENNFDICRKRCAHIIKDNKQSFEYINKIKDYSGDIGLFDEFGYTVANHSITNDLDYNIISLSSEVGEILNAVKKYKLTTHFHYGDECLKKEAEWKENLIEEIGDSLFYLVKIAHLCGVSLQTIIRNQKRKLDIQSEENKRTFVK